MHYLDYNEQIQHRTGDFPLAYYPVDRDHERYRMPMHWHREAELILVKKGRLELYIDNQAVTAEAGDLALIGEGVLHGGEPEDCQYACIVYDAAMLLHLDACKRALKPVMNHSLFLKAAAVASDGALPPALEGLRAAAAAGVAENAPAVLGALLTVYGALARCQNLAALDVAAPQTSQKAEQLKPALEYIETHYGQQITLETLARLTGLSPKYFCRFFHAIVHRSPIDYVNYYRVECASHFLTVTDMTVAEIAQRCGYNDSSFFIKQFRKYKGTTPRRYRQ